MDGGTLLWILLIGGGVAAMVFMHRGGHAHGGSGGGGCGGGHGGQGGHGQHQTPVDEPRDSTPDDSPPAAARQGSHGKDRETAAAGGKHRGC